MNHEQYEEWVKKTYDQHYLDRLAEIVKELREMLKHTRQYDNAYDAGMAKGIEYAIDVMLGNVE